MGVEVGEEFKNYKAATVQGVGLPGTLYFWEKKKKKISSKLTAVRALWFWRRRWGWFFEKEHEKENKEEKFCLVWQDNVTGGGSDRKLLAYFQNKKTHMEILAVKSEKTLKKNVLAG